MVINTIRKFSQVAVCINYKCYISIGLAFLKESILIKHVHQKRVIFVTICIFLDKGFNFQAYVCNGCHDVLMVSLNFSDNAISNINCADYCCIINRISKSGAINVLQNINLSEKSGTL